MKSKCSFILKAGLSLVLVLLLLFSTMATGIAAVVEDLAATGWNTSTDGVYFIDTDFYTSAGKVTAPAVTGLKNAQGWQDFDLLTAGTYHFLIIADGTYYGMKNGWGSAVAFNDSKDTLYGYARDDRYNAYGDFPAGQYVLKLDSGGGSNNYANFYLYRKKAFVDYGWDSAISASLNMTYDEGGEGVYKYTFTGTGGQLRFRMHFEDGATTTDYYPSTNDFIADNTDYDGGYTASQGSSSNYWYVDTELGTSYTLWLKNGKVWCSCYRDPVNFFLTGKIDNADTDIKAANKFTETTTSGVYTLTKTFTADYGNYQYVTVTDSKYQVYQPTSSDADSGTPSKSAINASNIYAPNEDPKWKVYAATGKTVTFTWDTRGTKPVLTWNIVSAMLYAKDGASPKDVDEDKYNFGNIADTTIIKLGDTDITAENRSTKGITQTTIGGSSGYEEMIVNVGDTITITTTIGESYRDEYYVKAFNINGQSVNVIDSSKANTVTGVYTLEYTMPADLTSSFIEITPLYYLVDNSDTVTYYLEGFDSSLGWGDSPYAYPFYGDLYDKDNAFGAYPGQPFLNVNNVYSIEIPITNVPLSGETGAAYIIPVKGVTISNGESDKIHKITNAQTGERQTYDSDGFYKIVNELTDSLGNKPSSLYQRIKLETTQDNRKKYGTSVPDDDDGVEGSDTDQDWGYGESNPADKLTAENVATIGSSDENGWELYTDRYNRPIDIFGNVIGNTYSAATEAAHSAIRVISTGYSSNIAGDYGTAWLIYLPDTEASTNNSTSDPTTNYTSSYYSLLKDTETKRYGMPPSILAIRNAEHFSDEVYPSTSKRDVESSGVTITYSDSVTNYQTMWQTLQDSWKGRYVYVTYESEQQRLDKADTRTGAYRVDSRWYYSFPTDMVKTDIKIEYWDGSVWVTDSTLTTGYNSKNNQGSASGCKAYFTNAGFDGDTSSGDLLIDTVDLTMSAAAGNNGGTYYMFDSWQSIDSDGNYTEVTRASNSITMTNHSNVTYVARFMPISDGMLNITHTASTPDLATTNIQVKVYNTSGGILLYDTGVVEDSVTLNSAYISNSHADYYLDVTLSTVMLGNNTFTDFTYDSAFESAYRTKHGGTALTHTESVGTTTFGFTVGDLYTGSAQNFKVLNYTSNVTIAPTMTYEYRYKDRTGAWQSYSSTIYVSAAEAEVHCPDYEGEVTVAGRTTKTTYADIAQALASRAPSSGMISVYQTKLDFSLDSGDAWDSDLYGDAPATGAFAKNAYHTTDKIVVVAKQTRPSYKLTYHYTDSSSASHNGSVEVEYGTPCTISDYKNVANFVGWSTAENDNTQIISPYQNFGMILTKNVEVWAVTTPVASPVFKPYIDLISSTREDGTVKLSVLCRYSNLTQDAVPDGTDYGVILLTGATDLSAYTAYNKQAIAEKLIEKRVSASSFTARLQADPQILASIYKCSSLNNYNRCIQEITANYSSVNTTNFIAYSYIVVGDDVFISDPVSGSFVGGVKE